MIKLHELLNQKVDQSEKNILLNSYCAAAGELIRHRYTSIHEKVCIGAAAYFEQFGQENENSLEENHAEQNKVTEESEKGSPVFLIKEFEVGEEWEKGRYEGETINGKRHGRGTFENRLGRKYVGEWKNDKRHGWGTSNWSSGSTYVGEFACGDFNGFGIYCSDGEKYIGEHKGDFFHGLGAYIKKDNKYFGEWQEQEKEGYGAEIKSDGMTYDGEWKSDVPTGQSIRKWPSGDKYIGEDRFNGGFGTYFWPSGASYAGAWKNNKKHGSGTYISSDGEIYVGEFKDDEKNGRGIKTWPDGEQYVGNWINGKSNGRGIATYKNGDKYLGEYKDDKRNGRGIYIYSDGETYVGDFEKSDRSGHGYCVYPDGSFYIGSWKGGQRNEGTFTSSDGKVKSGFWDGDKFIGPSEISEKESEVESEVTSEKQYEKKSKLDVLRLLASLLDTVFDEQKEIEKLKETYIILDEELRLFHSRAPEKGPKYITKIRLEDLKTFQIIVDFYHESLTDDDGKEFSAIEKEMGKKILVDVVVKDIDITLRKQSEVYDRFII